MCAQPLSKKHKNTGSLHLALVRSDNCCVTIEQNRYTGQFALVGSDVNCGNHGTILCAEYITVLKGFD